MTKPDISRIRYRERLCSSRTDDGITHLSQLLNAARRVGKLENTEFTSLQQGLWAIQDVVDDLRDDLRDDDVPMKPQTEERLDHN